MKKISRDVYKRQTHGNITDKDAYKKALYAREAEGSTYVDNGITVPHAKTNVVTRPSLAALRLSSPVQYNAEDDGTTDLLFAIAAPENGSLHVDMLARMMQMLMNEDFVEKLKAAKTPAEFLDCIDAQEEAQFGAESFTQQEIPQNGYRILAVTACVNGIAHTYMAAEALTKAGDKLGLPTKVETNGSDGAKNILTREEIANCEDVYKRQVQSMADLKGRTILSTGKGTTPEYVLRYLLTQNGIDPDKDVTIEYYSEATEVTAQMANTEDAIAVLPQPYVTAAGLQDDTLRVALDLTEEWNKVADTQLITGVTVVRKEYAEEHPDVVAAFLTDYAKSVEAANTDLDGTAALCEEQGVVAKAAIAKKALPECNIVCLTGDELKTNASAYLQVLFDADPKAVGGAMPGDDFYWTAE